MDHLANVKLQHEEKEFQLRERIKQLEELLLEHQDQIQWYADEVSLKSSIFVDSRESKSCHSPQGPLG